MQHSEKLSWEGFMFQRSWRNMVGLYSKMQNAKTNFTARETVIVTVSNRHTTQILFVWSQGSSACIPYLPFLLVIWHFTVMRKDGHQFKRELRTGRFFGYNQNKVTLRDHLLQQKLSANGTSIKNNYAISKILKDLRLYICEETRYEQIYISPGMF